MSEWAEAVDHLLAVDPERSLHPEVLEFLQGIGPRQSIVAACSGGADSVYMSLLTCAYCRLHGHAFALVHFNHHLRGADSDADAEFVAAMAQDLGVPLFSGEADVALKASEAALREARYEHFSKVLAECGSAVLVLGQHADDASESFMMGALSGAGLARLASPRPVSRFNDGHVRLRPLLHLRRGDIEARLSALGLGWRVDASNKDSQFTRNWIRNELLPLLEQRFPQDIHAGLMRTHHQLLEAMAAIDAVVASLELDVSNPVRFPVGALLSQPRGVVRRAWMLWWLQHYPRRQFPQGSMDALLDQIADGDERAPVSIAASQFIDWSDCGQYLQIEEVGAEDGLLWAGSLSWAPTTAAVLLPDYGRLSAERIELHGEEPFKSANPANTAWLQGAQEPLIVRQWQPGDRYRPLGAPGRRKLQDLFTDAKLDRPLRMSLPVITDASGTILWVPGFPPADSHKIRYTSDWALKLTYQRH